MGEHGIGTTSSAQIGATTSAGLDQPAPSTSEIHPVLPRPQGGAGSHDISTESSDPDVLRQHLERARERLTFYESFDRIIGENIRRSGELMLETISLREEAQERDRVVAQLEAERNAARAAEHTRNQTLLGGLLAEADSALAGLTILRTKLANALASTAATTDTPPVTTASNEERAEPESTSIQEEPAIAPATTDSAAATQATELPENQTSPGTPEISPVEAELEKPATEPEPQAAVLADSEGTPADASITTTPTSEADVDADVDVKEAAAAIEGTPISSPRMIDVLVHGVSRAPIALSLQNYLKALPGVSAVETREFAEGVLRLNIKTTNPVGLTARDFAAWSEGGNITTLSEQESVLELSLANDTDL